MIGIVTDMLRYHPSRLCKPTDFHHDSCPMLDQGCIQVTGDTAVHRKRKPPGVPVRGRQQNMCSLGRVVEVDGV
jgi:hypothetical protein